MELAFSQALNSLAVTEWVSVVPRCTVKPLQQSVMTQEDSLTLHKNAVRVLAIIGRGEQRLAHCNA